jgi:acyl-CoA synthetase (AMP-forming)/AMP-acid ligase II
MSHPTFVHVLRSRALRQPQNPAFTFLSDRGTEESILSYAELDQKARLIAANLQSLKLSGKPVLLLFPPGMDYVCAFFGCLYAGVVAVPAPLPRPGRPMRRLRAGRGRCRM